MVDTETSHVLGELHNTRCYVGGYSMSIRSGGVGGEKRGLSATQSVEACNHYHKLKRYRPIVNGKSTSVETQCVAILQGGCVQVVS